MSKQEIIWINGAEGFIGSWLWKLLSKHKNLQIYISSLKGDANLFGAKTEVIDICNAEEVSQFVKRVKPDRIVHLAAQSHPKYSFTAPKHTYEVNVIGTINVLSAIRENIPSADILLASTSAVYGDIATKKYVTELDAVLPLSPYGESKLAMEAVSRQYVECYGIKCKNVRIFNTTGPGKKGDVLNDFIYRVLDCGSGTQKEIKVGDLKSQRLFLDVRDTVDAIYLIMMKGQYSETYNICGDELFRPKDIILLLEKYLDSKITTILDDSLFRVREEKVIKGSNTKIATLGWIPKIKFQKTVFDALEWRILHGL